MGAPMRVVRTPFPEETRMNLVQELDVLRAERAALVMPAFEEEEAFRLGCLLRQRGIDAQLPIVIDISLFDRPLFYAALPGSTFDQREWARRKANVARRFHLSSYQIQLELQQRGTNLFDSYGLSENEYAAHGGAVPLRVRGCGVIGTVTVSGLPSHQDHRLVVEAIRELIARG
jgi:uncharacterized protein (UPF0303 family)